MCTNTSLLRRSGSAWRTGKCRAALGIEVFFAAMLAAMAAITKADGPVAEGIRQEAPPLDSNLYRAMREFQFLSVVPDWADRGTHVDAPKHRPHSTWRGRPEFAAVELNADLFAVLEAGRDGRVRLFHVDVANGQIRKQSDQLCTFQGRPVDRDLVKLHRLPSPDGPRLTIEFADAVVHETTILVEGGHKTMFHGDSRITRLPLHGGSPEILHDRTVRTPTARQCLHDLFRRRLPVDTLIEAPAIEDVIERLQERLEKRCSMRLDCAQTGCEFYLADEAFRTLREKAAALRIGPDVRHECRSLRAMVERLPSCPATRDLGMQLDLADAFVDGDTKSLERIMRGDFALGPNEDPTRRAFFRNLAACLRLNLIANDGDKLEDYQAFGRMCDASIQARDSAILRIDEIRFHAACQDATVAAFDRFLRESPSALQQDEAIAHAAALERETVDLRLENGDEAQSIATGLVNRWKASVDNKGRPLNAAAAHRATRLFGILSEHPALQETQAATDAQESADEHEARITQEAFQQKYLQIQEHQTLVMEQQLSLMREAVSGMSENLGNIGSQLRNIDGRLQQAAYRRR